MMRKTKKSKAVRIHKVKDKASHEWLYSQVLLYNTFKSEDDDLKDAREDPDICRQMFLNPVTCDLLEENHQDFDAVLGGEEFARCCQLIHDCDFDQAASILRSLVNLYPLDMGKVQGA